MDNRDAEEAQGIEDDYVVLSSPGSATAEESFSSGVEAELLEEYTSVQAAGETEVGSVQPPIQVTHRTPSSQTEDVIVCISDSDSEGDSILEVASHEQEDSNSADEADYEEESECEQTSYSSFSEPEENFEELPLPPDYPPQEEDSLQDPGVASLDSPEESPAQDTNSCLDSPEVAPGQSGHCTIFEISGDKEVSKPATLDGLSFDLTGDSSDDDGIATVVDESTGDSPSGDASAQVAAPNENMETTKEEVGEVPAGGSVDASCQTTEPPAEEEHNRSQPVRDIHVPSGDGADQQRPSAQSTKTTIRDRVAQTRKMASAGRGRGNRRGTISTAARSYRSPTLANASGTTVHRRSGLPNYRRNEPHFVDRLLLAVYPTDHVESVYTRTRGGFEYTWLLKQYPRKNPRRYRTGDSSNSRTVLLRSPFYEGPTRYGGASASRSNRGGHLLQVTSPGPPAAQSTNANLYQLVTPLLSSILPPCVPDESLKPCQSTSRSARSWNAPGTSTKRLRPPTDELVIPTITELMRAKRELLQSRSEAVSAGLDSDIEMDASELIRLPNVVADSIHSPAPTDTASTAGNVESKQITKIKTAITRTRTSTVTSGQDPFAPAPRHALPAVALPGLTSLPQFCFGPLSSQSAGKMTSNQQQQQSVSAAAAFQFAQPEILASWTIPSSRQNFSTFDFGDPIFLEPVPLPKTGAGKWECATCMLFNDLSIDRCVACDCPQPTRAKEATTTTTNNMHPNPTLAATSGFSFDSQRSAVLVPLAPLPKTGSGKWECPTCMLFNELNIDRCIACDCPQPTKAKEAAMKPIQMTAAGSTADFNSIVKTQTAKGWECQDCCVRNAANQQRCICCGAASKTYTTYSLEVDHHAAASNIPATSGGFKALAQQQKSGKWECSMCLTRNDEVALRCVCCKQPKPSTNQQPLVASSKAPEQTVSSVPFVSTTASEHIVDFQPVNQPNVGNTSTTTQTFGTVAHSSTTPTATTGVGAETCAPDEADATKTGFKYSRYRQVHQRGHYRGRRSRRGNLVWTRPRWNGTQPDNDGKPNENPE